MAPLVDQWEALLAQEPSDWSHLVLELRLDDPDRTEEAVVAMAPLNPWRDGNDYRTGVLRFEAARTQGYGAAAQLVRRRMLQLDVERIAGSLRLLRGIDALNLVGTQGPR